MQADVCGDLLSEEDSIILLHNWIPSGMSCNEASQLFLSSVKTNLNTYTKCMVYLCAHTLGILYGYVSKTLPSSAAGQSVSEEDGNSYINL